MIGSGIVKRWFSRLWLWYRRVCMCDGKGKVDSSIGIAQDSTGKV